VVDTLGILIAVVVVAASVSDNAGGIAVMDRARNRSSRLAKIWCDGGFKKTFAAACGAHHISAVVV
jgi:transposase